MLLMLIMIMPVAEAEDRIIMIGLLDNVDGFSVGAERGVRVLVNNGDSLVLDGDREYSFELNNGTIIFDKYFLSTESLLIWSARQGDLLKINGREYRGYMEILKRDDHFTVINHLNFSDYLASVVGSEINPNWSEEVLKAQAVVARTYALRNMQSHAAKGYNLSSTVRSQAYKGVSFEDERTLQAVKETAGEVVTYNGNLIAAVYHSTAGGQTAKGEIIWGSKIPYLQSVISNDEESPYYSWQKEFSKEELERLFREQGINIVDLKGIVLDNLGPSGRAEKIIINDRFNGDNKVDSSKFRFWLGLRSTKFTVIKVTPIFLAEDDEHNQPEIAYLFKGYGWGHGVGMSQWGAYQLAKEGFDYQEILQHYYINTEITILDGGIGDEG